MGLGTALCNASRHYNSTCDVTGGYPPVQVDFTSYLQKNKHSAGQCQDKYSNAGENAFGYEFLTRFARIIERRLEATRLQLLDVYGKR